MKIIPNKVSFLILAAILLVVLVISPKVSLQNRGILITAIVVFSSLFLLIFSKKLSKNYSPQPSDIPMIEKAILVPGIICSIFLILSTYDILDWAINSREPEFAGWEFLLFMPIILLSLAAQISPLIFLLAKKNKQAIILLIVQCFLLLSLVGALCLFRPISEWSSKKYVEKYDQLMKEQDQRLKVEREKFLSTPRIKNLALPTPEAPILSFASNREYPFINVVFTYPTGDRYQLLNVYGDKIELFNVYKAENPDGPWALIKGDINYDSIQDFVFPKNVKTLYYRIAVSDGNYGEGPYSPVSSVDLP